ncbi:Kinesin-like protein kif24 [Rhizophlyctis rosea]|uniref:Kinesin-like protein n=1 Tax=Rhizophlyctis rosea TaxID=64517 RepID=A0AAD5WYJ3_9FUNG|nr:Kinesin-like protein kif24 [Rhizophlyctis rosea]
MAAANPPSDRFSPPPAFIQASLARQAQIKQNQKLRAALAHHDENAGETITKTSGVNSGFGVLISSAESPGGTVLQIAQLKERREKRRKQQEELRKAKEGVDDSQWDIMQLTDRIEAFRKDCRQQVVETPDISIEGLEGNNDNMRIRVCVRKRPINETEIANNNIDILTTRTATYPNAQIHIHEPKTRLDLSRDIETHSFGFDNVFDEKASNKDLYASTVAGLVEGIFQGGKVTLFAYGQTGSGKTHTIFGSPTEPGLFHHIAKDIMLLCAQSLSDTTGPLPTLHLSFFELYGPQIYDLLNSRTRLTLLESPNPKDPIYIQNLTSVPIPTVNLAEGLEKLLALIAEGFKSRSTGSTQANSHSSRSHAVLQLTLKNPTTLRPLGKFSLIDLAGSERATDRGPTTSLTTKWESSEINKSLLSLKECIRALHQHKPTGVTARRKSGTGKHIPFRGSKLTHVLRDSFMGRGNRTVMIACVAPGMRSCECTLNTLRYAGRVKGYGGMVNSKGSTKVVEKAQEEVTVRSRAEKDDAGGPMQDRDHKENSDGVTESSNPSSAYNTDNESGDTFSPSSLSDDEIAFAPQPRPSGTTTTIPLTSLSVLLRTQPPTSQFTKTLLESHLIALTARHDLVEAEKRMMMSMLDGDEEISQYAEGLEKVVRKRMAVDEELLAMLGRTGSGNA